MNTSEITWQDLPERDEVFIQHSLSVSEAKILEDAIENHSNAFASSSMEYGKALVDPFDVELIEGGEKILMKKRPKAITGTS
jgi:hypothetical protein